MEDEGNPYEQAKILEAGKHMTTHDPTNPTWRYRMRGGKVEGKVFPAAAIPEGWEDSPAKCVEEPPETIVLEPKEPYIAPESQIKPKRKYTRKVRDGDSA